MILMLQNIMIQRRIDCIFLMTLKNNLKRCSLNPQIKCLRYKSIGKFKNKLKNQEIPSTATETQTQTKFKVVYTNREAILFELNCKIYLISLLLPDSILMISNQSTLESIQF
jgi:hypothetical protein